MSIIMADVVARLEPNAAQAYRENQLFELLYADDTLLIGANPDYVGHFAALVERAGADYGMSLHWGKTQALAVRTLDHVKKPDGTPMDHETSLLYLGSVIDGHGRSDSEISRKLGIGKADFRVLSKVWRLANVPIEKKLQFFHGLIRFKAPLWSVNHVVGHCAVAAT